MCDADDLTDDAKLGILDVRFVISNCMVSTLINELSLDRGGPDFWFDPLGNRMANYASERYARLCSQRQKAEIDFKQCNEIQEEQFLLFSNKLIRQFKALGDNLHPRFIGAAGVFAEWVVSSQSSREAFIPERTSFDGNIKDRSEVILIDWKKNWIKAPLKALFTLGFLTRKRAKESLVRVQEQEEVLLANVQQTKAELDKRCDVLLSFKQVVAMITDLVEMYRRLIEELEYISLMHSGSCLILNPMDSHRDAKDCYFLPGNHLKCLMVCDKVTRILSDVGKIDFAAEKCITDVSKIDVDVKNCVSNLEIAA